MKMLAVFLFAVLIGCAHAQFFGVPVSVTAGVAKTTSFYGVITVTIKLDRTASYTLNLYEDLTIGTSVTAGYSSLNSAPISGNISATYSSGVNLTVSGGAVVVSCDITVSTALSLSTILNAGGQVGFIQYDGSVQWYNTLYASSSNAFDYTVPVPGAGLYLFVSWSSTANLPTFYSYARQIKANAQQTITYAHNTTVQLINGVNSTLTAIYYATNPYSVQATGYVALGTFFDLQCSATSNLTAVISYAYSAAQLTAAGVHNASSLVIGYFDPTSTKWVFPTTGGSVNTNTQVVSQWTTHFSTWGVYAASSSSSGSTSTTATTSAAPPAKAIPLVSVFLMLMALIF